MDVDFANNLGNFLPKCNPRQKKLLNVQFFNIWPFNVINLESRMFSESQIETDTARWVLLYFFTDKWKTESSFT